MRQRSPKQRRTGLLAVVCVVVMAVAWCVFALPARAVAKEAAVIAHSGEGDQRVNYTSVDDAMGAGYNGATIVMDADWSVGTTDVFNTSYSLEITAGKKITIDMNGHTINNSVYKETLRLGKGSELTLTSSRKVKIQYKGYSTDDGSKRDFTVSAGGLVTNTTPSYCGIVVGESAKLTLDGVAVAGCRGAQNSSEPDLTAFGGLTLCKNSTLNMQNGAVIEHNRSFKYGGGVYAQGKDVTINMSNSSIRDNWANEYGGGIYFYDAGATLTMNDGASIEGNTAESGGGIQFVMSGFNVTSKDGEAYIRNNRATASSRTSDKFAQSGGGIHIEQVKSTSNNGLIEGITISGNYSAYDGGGIELDQEYITIRKCVIKDNWCKYEGGGIYDCNDGNLLEDCTITGNACSVDSGGNYEGGGVFVWHSYDLRLKGVCVIKGNTRGKDSGNADDIMLRENGGASAKAYIEGNLSKGSSVGVRTGVTGDRRIARNFKHETNDCLFYDMSGYYVSYGGDEGGDAWQRYTAVEFAVSIDGKAYGRYRDGTTAAVAAPATKDGKVFWRWDTGSNGTTGLYPVGDYISEKNMFSNALAFTMPQNDVNLVPIYINRVTAVRFQVEAPEAGRALATAGKLWRSDGGVSAESAPCSVYWYEVDEHGNVSDTAAAGLAKANTAYRAYLVAPEARDLGFFYDDEVSVAVSLVSASGDLVKELEPDAIKTYLTLSNDLAAHVDDAYTTGPGSGEVETGTVKVRLENQGLLGGGASAAAAMALDDSADAQAALIGTVEVSYAYDEDTKTVTIAAPEQEGFNFCNWEVEGDVEVSDEGTVTLPVSELLNIESLTAVYTPVVTKVEVEMDGPAPTAGEKLATSVDKLVLTGSDGSTLDLVKEIGAGSAAVTWSPESEDGLADYSTAYTALVELAEGDGLEDVEKVVASNAKVSVTAANGAVDAEAAGFTVVDGKLCLAVSFAKTDTLRAVSVEQPADVEVSFEDAAAGEWGLPKTVGVKLENGELAEGDVTWEAVEGFDANATTAQVLTAKGTVTHVVYDGELDTDGLDTAVTVTVKVAAPAKQAEDAAKTETTTVTETTTAKTKKGTPATGDVTFTGAAGLLAAAAVCLAASRVSRRER